MWTDDPVADEALRTLQGDAWRQKQLALRPRCRLCDQPIEEDTCIDLSGGYGESVFHKSCIEEWLKQANGENEWFGEELMDAVNDMFTHRVWVREE